MTRSTLRIGLICPYSLTVPGGVQMQVLALARELRRRGHGALVLGPCDGPPPAEFVLPLGNSLPTAANGSIAPLAPDLPAALRTVRAIREEGFDVLHLHEPLAPGPTVTALLIHPVPIVATFHAAGRSTSYRMLAPALARIARRIDRRVVVSKDAQALVQRYLGGEYEVLFNGVEVDTIRATAPAAPAPGGDAVVFFCGRHEERKGLRVLVEAFAQLVGDGVGARLWIAGTGPDTDVLRRFAAADRRLAGRIDWLGRVSDADKFARLRRADVFCAPSLGGESFGVVLIEAMAAGTTVVASDLDGYRNVATDRHDARLVTPGDPAALAQTLREVLSDPDQSAELRAHGESRAHEFAMSRLADRYLDAYRAVLAAAQP